MPLFLKHKILKLFLQYLKGTLTDEFSLDCVVKSKPVIEPDDILLLLTHHWARDTSTFPTEDQCLALAALMLLAIYNDCQPGELVDTSKDGTAY